MVRPQAASFRQALLAGRWFSTLDEPFAGELLKHGEVLTLADRQTVFLRGDAAGVLYAVVSGAVVVATITEAGREVLLTRMEAPNWFGEISVFDRQPRTHDVVADGAVVLVHVPLPGLDAILSAAPVRWRDLGLLASSKLRLMFQTLEEASTLSLAQRLVRRLLLLSESHGGRSDALKQRSLVISQEQLASMLASSRQSVNQVLKDLEHKGLVKIAYGAIEIIDFEGRAAAAL